VTSARLQAWPASAEKHATSWIIAEELPAYQAEVTARRSLEVERARTAVSARLNAEINRLSGEAMLAKENEDLGKKVKESTENLSRKAADLESRLVHRLELLERRAQVSAKPPRVVSAALVLPLELVDSDLPADVPMHAKETKEVERRGVEAVLAVERIMGRDPEEQAFNNPGFDILSTADSGDTIRIEVKARIEGAEDFFITHNEVLVGKNSAPNYRLALVRVSTVGPEEDELVYVLDPFASTDLGGLDATGIRIDWEKTWAKGVAPI